MIPLVELELDVYPTPLLRQGLAGFRVEVAINGFDRGIGTEKSGSLQRPPRCYSNGPSSRETGFCSVD